MATRCPHISLNSSQPLHTLVLYELSAWVVFLITLVEPVHTRQHNCSTDPFLHSSFTLNTSFNGTYTDLPIKQRNTWVWLVRFQVWQGATQTTPLASHLSPTQRGADTVRYQRHTVQLFFFYTFTILSTSTRGLALFSCSKPFQSQKP